MMIRSILTDENWTGDIDLKPRGRFRSIVIPAITNVDMQDNRKRIIRYIRVRIFSKPVGFIKCN
jgi:hypothetical protein